MAKTSNALRLARALVITPAWPLEWTDAYQPGCMRHHQFQALVAAGNAWPPARSSPTSLALPFFLALGRRLPLRIAKGISISAGQRLYVIDDVPLHGP